MSETEVLPEEPTDRLSLEVARRQIQTEGFRRQSAAVSELDSGIKMGRGTARWSWGIVIQFPNPGVSRAFGWSSGRGHPARVSKVRDYGLLESALGRPNAN